MIIRRITVAYFSPTGNVKKAALSIGAAAVSAFGNSINSSVRDAVVFASGKTAGFEEYDFLRPEARMLQADTTNNCSEENFTAEERVLHFGEDELLIIGLPVYAGRLPNKILPFVQNAFKGSNTPCIPFVCYGNRSFGDALAELVMEMRNNSFVICGGGAIVSEHSFCPELATGRPDVFDLKFIGGYAGKICELIKEADGQDELIQIDKALEIPGNMPPGPYYTPLKEDGTPAVFLKAKPKTDTDKCDKCMECVSVCPFGSISSDDPADVPGICIKCQACVKVCHTGARYFDNEDFLSHKRNLAANYSRRLENLFL
jgi:ferredoxin